MSWYVNYQATSQIDVSDRGLAYGDGLFETLSYSGGELLRLNAHLGRLFSGLEQLGMPFSSAQKEELANFLDTLVDGLSSASKVLKIIVTRGQGGRGYLPPSECLHNVLIGLLDAPDYRAIRQTGVSLAISDVPISVNPHTAGLKHLNKLDHVLAKQALPVDCFEAVMLTPYGEVIECIQSNIFWFKNEQLFTPDLCNAGVKGTLRAAIINEQAQFNVVQGRYLLSDLDHAEEIFITNSLMQIIPVNQIKGRELKEQRLTQQLMQLFN